MVRWWVLLVLAGCWSGSTTQTPITSRPTPKSRTHPVVVDRRPVVAPNIVATSQPSQGLASLLPTSIDGVSSKVYGGRDIAGVKFHVHDHDVWIAIGTGHLDDTANKVWRGLAPGQTYVDKAWTHRGYVHTGIPVQIGGSLSGPPTAGALVELPSRYWFFITIRGTDVPNDVLPYLDYVDLRAMSSYATTRSP